MMKKFEATGVFPILSAREINPVAVEAHKSVAQTVEEETAERTHKSCNIQRESRQMELPFNNESNIILKMLHYCSYQIRCLYQI